MITWQHYERLLGGTLSAKLNDIPNRNQVIRLADAKSWTEFVSLVSSIKGLTTVDEKTSLRDIINLSKKHLKDELADYFAVVEDDRPISIALFPDWFIKNKKILVLEDMVEATIKLWKVLESLDDRYLIAEYDEWYRYLLLFLYKRAYDYHWNIATVRKLFIAMPMGDKVAILLERGEVEAKQVASILGLSTDIGDMEILDLEVLIDEYMLMKLSDLTMTSNPLYEIIFYYRALDTAYRNIQIVATGVWGELPREEIVKRVREVYV